MLNVINLCKKGLIRKTRIFGDFFIISIIAFLVNLHRFQNKMVYKLSPM